ncbi:MAG: cell division protein ZapE [Pseudomonadaceae bacterium]|nr:cell division protein ZapE [Pseudomonadaceae bacterium]
MRPDERYREELQRHGFTADPAQEKAIEALSELYDRLVARDARQRGGVGGWWANLRGKPLQPEKGLYFWGGVGRGKTFLMDLFHDCLPFPDKTRMHFHRFMHGVHADLTRLAGTKNPLATIADEFANRSRVLCFDEFFVSDIADAMLLGELLDALFSRGVTLVTTSNIEPSGLYPNGLQRSRFLPAISLIEQHTDVLNIDGGIDYRLRVLERAEIYHSPLDDAALDSLNASFTALAMEVVDEPVTLTIENRPIMARRCAEDVVWFDFEALCAGPRSAADYIEIARLFHAVLVSDVPTFTSNIEDQARRFISLVDELYDHNVKLILSAAQPLQTLYQGTTFSFEFERTMSRLLEMRSHDYLARTHKG